MRIEYKSFLFGRFGQLLAVLWTIFLSQAWAQRNLRPDAIPKPDPQAQLKTFVMDEGLEVNLFASDPMISKPIGMNWDEQGRLWVVSSRLYPQIKPGERSDDKVIVLEDSNADGVADKSTVFAENLIIPTGIMPGDGGAYVANSTEILFLRDTDGDLREDDRDVVLSGFGTEDTHHIIHAFRGGPDGMLYFNQSIYIHSHVETPYGVRRLLAGGIWHYRPESGELEVFSRGFVNSWGHIFDRYGQSFATDGAYGEGINYVFPGSVFVTAHSSKKILRGLNPGQPKHCGLEVVNSSHFPAEWQGNLITNDFRGHRVNRFVISESGSGYVSRQAPDLIRTSHSAFRPIDVKIGPDGALYIADWYNPIIQHGEVDFRDPRRDHVHGRIWRVTYKGRKLSSKPRLAGQSVPVIVDQLRSEDGYTRHFAKRRLRQEDQGKVKQALGKLALRNGISSEDKLEILWAHQSVNHLEETILRELLVDQDHRIRAATVRVIYHWHKRMKDALELLGVAAVDAHPQVRLEAVSALRQLGGIDAFRKMLPVFGMQKDKNLDFALWLAARELQEAWLPALEEGSLSFRGKLPVLDFLLKAIEKPQGLRFLRGSLASKTIKPEGFRELASLFADVGAADDLGMLYDSALDNVNDIKLRGFVMGELSRAAKQRNVRPKNLRSRDLLELMKGGDQMAALLCGAWEIVEAKEGLIRWLADDSRSGGAAEALSLMGAKLGNEGRNALVGLASNRSRNIGVRISGLVAIASIDLQVAAPLAANLLSEVKSTAGVSRIYDCFLSRVGGADALAKAVSEKKIAVNVAAAGVTQAESSGGGSPGLIEALSIAGNLDPIVQALSEEEMIQLVADVKSSGDADRGEIIYRRSQLLCQACHAIGGGGGLVGPDLVSIGSSAPLDYIVESLLEPAKKIKEGYHTTVLTTKAGGVLTGALIRESGSELVLRMIDGSEKRIAVSSVAKKEIAPVSLMPPGLTSMLRKDEFLDLVKFLSELGKEGRYKVPSKRFARRWRVISSDHTLDLKKVGKAQLGALLQSGAELPWSPDFSMVSGQLPLTSLGVSSGAGSQLSFAKVELEVSAGGKIGLRTNNPKGLQLSFGESLISADDEVAIELGVGRHEVVIIVDRALREHGGIRIELFDVPGSVGRAGFVTGY